MSHGRPRCARWIIEGQSVRCIETADGKRVWLCDCPKFKERATQHPEGFCAHTAVAIWRSIEDSSRGEPLSSASTVARGLNLIVR